LRVNGEGREINAFFARHFCTKKQSTYQDRLGTDIEKTLRKRALSAGTSRHVHGSFEVVNAHGYCRAELSEPCPGCGTAAPLSERDVNVTWQCAAAAAAAATLE
jgi:hypothetical protein